MVKVFEPDFVYFKRESEMRKDYYFYIFAILCFALALITFFGYDLLAVSNLIVFAYGSRDLYFAVLFLLGIIFAGLGYLNRK